MCCNLPFVSRHFPDTLTILCAVCPAECRTAHHRHICTCVVQHCLSLCKLTSATVLFAATLTYLYSAGPVFKPRTGYPGFPSVPSCKFWNINFNMPRPFPCTYTFIKRTHAASCLPALYSLCS